MNPAKFITLGAWVIYWTGFLLIKKFQLVRKKNNVSVDPRSRSPLTWLIVLHFVLYSFFWLGIGGFKNNPALIGYFYPAATFIGVILLIVGVIFSIFSRYCLGSSWSFLAFVSSDRPFIKNGSYGFVRHPIYLGLFVIWIGASFVFFNWIGIISAFIVLLPLLYHRAKIEEENFIKIFSENYLNYIRRTGMIFPKIKTFLPSSLRSLLKK